MGVDFVKEYLQPGSKDSSLSMPHYRLFEVLANLPPSSVIGK